MMTMPVTTGPFKKGDYELNLITVPDGNDDWLNFCPFPFLTRGLGDGNTHLPHLANVELPSQAEVDAAMAVSAYDVAPFNPLIDCTESFRNCLGGWGGPNGTPTLHNVIHTWTGGAWDSTSYRFTPAEGKGWYSGDRSYVGTMQALQTSANDPVFFIHHANVDRIWQNGRQKMAMQAEMVMCSKVKKD